MLFTQQDLGVSTNAFGILNESIYIDHNTISPNTASVIVNEDINAGIVRFSDVESISEEYGCDYIDAMIAIAESNDIDIEQLAVAVDEARIIEEPDIIYELANVVINPISENSLAYVFCESMVDAYIDSGDEDYLACIIDEEVLMEYAQETLDLIDMIKKDPKMNNMEKVQAISSIKAKAPKVNATYSSHHQQIKHLKSQHSKELAAQKVATINNFVIAKDAQDKLDRVSKAHDTLAQQHADLSNTWYNKLGSKVDKIGKAVWKHHGKIAAGAAVGALAYHNKDKIKSGIDFVKGKFGKKETFDTEAVLKQAEGKPKSWISKKIASLRSIYQNYLQKAREAGPNAGTFKQIAAKILSVIDALLKKLENATA